MAVTKPKYLRELLYLTPQERLCTMLQLPMGAILERTWTTSHSILSYSPSNKDWYRISL